MDSIILEKLSEITAEEVRLLEGEALDLNAYSDGGNGPVDSGKLMETGKLIAVRPNTRFTSFPRHCHNYV